MEPKQVLLYGHLGTSTKKFQIIDLETGKVLHVKKLLICADGQHSAECCLVDPDTDKVQHTLLGQAKTETIPVVIVESWLAPDLMDLENFTSDEIAKCPFPHFKQVLEKQREKALKNA